MATKEADVPLDARVVFGEAAISQLIDSWIAAAYPDLFPYRAVFRVNLSTEAGGELGVTLQIQAGAPRVNILGANPACVVLSIALRIEATPEGAELAPKTFELDTSLSLAPACGPDALYLRLADLALHVYEGSVDWNAQLSSHPEFLAFLRTSDLVRAFETVPLLSAHIADLRPPPTCIIRILYFELRRDEEGFLGGDNEVQLRGVIRSFTEGSTDELATFGLPFVGGVEPGVRHVIGQEISIRRPSSREVIGVEAIAFEIDDWGAESWDAFGVVAGEFRVREAPHPSSGQTEPLIEVRSSGSADFSTVTPGAVALLSGPGFNLALSVEHGPERPPLSLRIPDGAVETRSGDIFAAPVRVAAGEISVGFALEPVEPQLEATVEELVIEDDSTRTDWGARFSMLYVHVSVSVLDAVRGERIQAAPLTWNAAVDVREIGPPSEDNSRKLSAFGPVQIHVTVRGLTRNYPEDLVDIAEVRVESPAELQNAQLLPVHGRFEIREGPLVVRYRTEDANYGETLAEALNSNESAAVSFRSKALESALMTASSQLPSLYFTVQDRSAVLLRRSSTPRVRIDAGGIHIEQAMRLDAFVYPGSGFFSSAFSVDSFTLKFSARPVAIRGTGLCGKGRLSVEAVEANTEELLNAIAAGYARGMSGVESLFAEYIFAFTSIVGFLALRMGGADNALVFDVLDGLLRDVDIAAEPTETLHLRADLQSVLIDDIRLRIAVKVASGARAPALEPLLRRDGQAILDADHGRIEDYAFVDADFSGHFVGFCEQASCRTLDLLVELQGEQIAAIGGRFYRDGGYDAPWSALRFERVANRLHIEWVSEARHGAADVPETGELDLRYAHIHDFAVQNNYASSSTPVLIGRLKIQSRSTDVALRQVRRFLDFSMQFPAPQLAVRRDAWLSFWKLAHVRPATLWAPDPIERSVWDALARAFNDLRMFYTDPERRLETYVPVYEDAWRLIDIAARHRSSFLTLSGVTRQLQFWLDFRSEIESLLHQIAYDNAANSIGADDARRARAGLVALHIFDALVMPRSKRDETALTRAIRAFTLTLLDQELIGFGFAPDERMLKRIRGAAAGLRSPAPRYLARLMTVDLEYDIWHDLYVDPEEDPFGYSLTQRIEAGIEKHLRKRFAVQAPGNSIELQEAIATAFEKREQKVRSILRESVLWMCVQTHERDSELALKLNLSQQQGAIGGAGRIVGIVGRAWDLTHPALLHSSIAFDGPGSYTSGISYDTALLSMLAARKRIVVLNDLLFRFGCEGWLSPAEFRLFPAPTLSALRSVLKSAADLPAGSILIAPVTRRKRHGAGYVQLPLEADPDLAVALKAAIAKGIICLIAAGSSSTDLDAINETSLAEGRIGSSGAILVASDSPRANFGSLVDVRAPEGPFLAAGLRGATFISVQEYWPAFQERPPPPEFWTDSFRHANAALAVVAALTVRQLDAGCQVADIASAVQAELDQIS